MTVLLYKETVIDSVFKMILLDVINLHSYQYYVTLTVIVIMVLSNINF